MDDRTEAEIMTETEFRRVLLDVFIREVTHATSRANYLRKDFMYEGTPDQVLNRFYELCLFPNSIFWKSASYESMKPTLLQWMVQYLPDYQRIFYFC